MASGPGHGFSTWRTALRLRVSLWVLLTTLPTLGASTSPLSMSFMEMETSFHVLFETYANHSKRDLLLTNHNHSQNDLLVTDDTFKKDLLLTDDTLKREADRESKREVLDTNREVLDTNGNIWGGDLLASAQNITYHSNRTKSRARTASVASTRRIGGQRVGRRASDRKHTNLRTPSSFLQMGQEPFVPLCDICTYVVDSKLQKQAFLCRNLEDGPEQRGCLTVMEAMMFWIENVAYWNYYGCQRVTKRGDRWAHPCPSRIQCAAMLHPYTHKPFCPGDPSFPISWDGKKSKARQPTTDEKGFDDEGPPQCAKDPCDNVDLYEGPSPSTEPTESPTKTKGVKKLWKKIKKLNPFRKKKKQISTTSPTVSPEPQ